MMNTIQPYLPWVYPILYLTAHVTHDALTAHACTFPDYLQWQEGDGDYTWHTRVRNSQEGEVFFSVRHNVLDITHDPDPSSKPVVRWKCALNKQGKFLLKRRDPETLHHYSACVKFLRRSDSIVQVMWSEQRRGLDPALCEDGRLRLDPWLLVSFRTVMDDYTPSPFSGGFSMRITDSERGENGCNYMHRPMKFEVNCLAGEGVIFDFISQKCLPTSTAMTVRQRTLTVASWKHEGDYYVVLCREDVRDLYCLRVPATSEGHMNAFLFTDLACLSGRAADLLNVVPAREVRYLVLHLQRYVYRKLCDDEYPQCSAVTCNSYIRHECQRSCGVCDVNRPPSSCSFPRRVRGHWLQVDRAGVTDINITDREMIVQGVGSFRCVQYPDSPSRRTRMHTTVSMFDNGCRPRYTCVRFKRLGPSVLRYSLSRSYIWPDLEKEFGTAICAESQFGVDPEPIDDLYRSEKGTGKAIIHNDVKGGPPERVPCNLTSSFTLTATLQDGSTCHGSLFQHCQDSTRLRILLHAGCGQLQDKGETLVAPYHLAGETESEYVPPHVTDFACLAHVEGHYWERMVVVQSEADPRDARCLAFTQLDASLALVMTSAECDRHSWSYARTGTRSPLMSLRLRPDEFPCKYLPVTSTLPPVTSPAETRVPGVPPRDWDPDSPRASVTVTYPPHPHQHSSADYEKPREGTRTHYDPVLSPPGKGPGSGAVPVSPAARIVLVVCGSAVVLLAGRLDWVNR